MHRGAIVRQRPTVCNANAGGNAMSADSGYDVARRRFLLLCYILCIAVPRGVTGLQRSFGGEVSLDPLSDEPLASATIGEHPEREAYALTINGCSCDLLAGGHRMEGKPELAIEGLAKLLNDTPEAVVLNHWFTQPIADVAVTCKSEQAITMAKFRKVYPRLDEDVRYIIKK